MALKNISNGDVFFGPDMDSLVLNSTMRFASAAERAATMVGDLAPFAGARSFLADTKVMHAYNGSAWTVIPPIILFGFAGYSFTVPSATVTVLGPSGTLSLNLLGSYNYGGWFNSTTGRFQPGLPGYYEFVGGACFDNGSGGSYGSGSRSVGLKVNGAAAILATSVCALTGPSSNYVTTVSMRPYAQYMNGTSDYVELAVHHSAGASINTIYDTGPMFASYFSGKWLGG